MVSSTALSIFVLQLLQLFALNLRHSMCNFELGILHFCCKSFAKMVFLRMTYWTTVYTHTCTRTHIYGVVCEEVWWCVGVVCGVNIVRVQQ